MNTDSDSETYAREGEGAVTAPSLSRRMQLTMLLRVALVTLLLGSAIAVNLDSLQSFDEPRNATILALIVVTYLASLGYTVWLRRGVRLERLGYIQVVSDTAVIGTLVAATGGIDSIFPFLFLISVFNGAYLFGRTGALFGASMATLTLTAVVLATAVELPELTALMPELAVTAPVAIYSVVVHYASFFAVAILSGLLTDKLGDIGRELQQQAFDYDALRAWNASVVQSMRSGLVTIDATRRIVLVNPAASKIFKQPVGPLIGESISFLPALASVVAELTDSNPRLDRVESTLTRADGRERILGVSVSPLIDPTNRASGHMILFQDLTEVKRLERENRRRGHLAAIGSLSAAIAHEIRNPLAAISGSVEMLAMGPAANGEDRVLLTIVEREVERLNVLITDFLGYARPQPLSIASCSVLDLLEPTRLSMMTDPDLADRVSFAIHDPDLRVSVDANRIQQVVWNLVRNAREAPNATKVVVDVSATVAGGLVIRVSDDGDGVDPASLDRLFEPFFTTKTSGTGLGLSVSHQIVSAHGGTLLAENTSNGARFSVILGPLSESWDGPPATTATSIPPAATLEER